MQNHKRKAKEIKVPGPDHTLVVVPFSGTVQVTVSGRTVADTKRALQLDEASYPSVYYIPREDTDMSLLVPTTHYTYCPYKGDCSYFSIPIGGPRSEYAVWTYEEPYDAVAEIKNHLAFYPSRVDEITVRGEQ
ncbi:DUF427 domain-containing protein [Tunturiibacter lichenicola]|uniref:DUF427 domain-containing protein n=1 Tax=Tunturiibacter lichenicola TaxID=2051959 RepID=UPI0021B48141|nr:DUF427 domain-containing protein [Edaphobacter lichenicola]